MGRIYVTYDDSGRPGLHGSIGIPQAPGVDFTVEVEDWEVAVRAWLPGQNTSQNPQPLAEVRVAVEGDRLVIESTGPNGPASNLVTLLPDGS
jgi:hypothetical protein